MPSVYVCPNAAWACYLSGKWTEKWSGRKLSRESIPFANFIFRYHEFNTCSDSWKGKLHWWICRLLGWRAQATSRLPPPLAIVHYIMGIDSNKEIQLSLAMRRSKTSSWHFRDFIRHFNLSIFSLCLGTATMKIQIEQNWGGIAIKPGSVERFILYKTIKTGRMAWRLDGVHLALIITKMREK